MPLIDLIKSINDSLFSLIDKIKRKKETRKDFELKFRDLILIKIPNEKMLSEIWSFISSACFSYHIYKNIPRTKRNLIQFNNFFEKFKLVSIQSLFDKENKEIVYFYDNYFNNDKKGKKLISNIILFEKENNYPFIFF